MITSLGLARLSYRRLQIGNETVMINGSINLIHQELLNNSLIQKYLLPNELIGSETITVCMA